MSLLQKFSLFAPDGARAEIHLQGGQVTSWIPAGGTEQLFLSANSEYRAGTAIRGGVPVIFPQFAALGSLPKHGFARNLFWKLDGIDLRGDSAVAALTLRESETTRQIWNFPFTLSLTIHLGGPELSVQLGVTNTGAQAFSFSGALHTYLRVNDAACAALEGLGGQPYVDKAGGLLRHAAQTEPRLLISGEVDRIYPQAPVPLLLRDSDHALKISSQGFPDCVVWNPGPALASQLTDLEPEGWRRFVCVEAAVAQTALMLSPGETWQGAQTLVVEQAFGPIRP